MSANPTPWRDYDEVEERLWLAFVALDGAAPTLERDFVEALSEGRKARRILERALKNGPTHRLASRSIRAFKEASTKADLRSIGILVMLAALIDELLIRLIGPQKKFPAPFGPVLSGGSFGALLLAGANSARHEHEWWQASREAILHVKKLSERDAIEKLTRSKLQPRQLASVDALSQLTGIRSPEPFLSWRILESLASGDFGTLRSRMVLTFADLAAGCARSDAFRKVVSDRYERRES